MKKRFKFIFLVAILCGFVSFSDTILYAAPFNEAYTDGYDEGWFDGIESAEEDIEEDNRRSYSRAQPSENEITEKYDLDNESSNYRNNFIDGYKDGFKYGYNETYETYNEDDEEDNEINSINYADTLGLVMGKSYGSLDYYNSNSNDWKDALPSNSLLIDIFNLKKESKEYRNNFIEAFKDNFKEGYEKGYEEAKYSPFKASYEQGSTDGKYFGKLLGDIYGKRDFYLENSNDWERNLPSINKIINDFSLNKDSNEYLDGFISAFNYAFEGSYNTSFRNSNNKINSITYENGYNNGKEIGLKRGEGYAQIDFILNQAINTSRHISYVSETINEFNLNLETEEFREGFISGYNEGVTEGYISKYQDFSYNSIITNLETKAIPISGGRVSTIDKRMSIDIVKGTYFNDVVLSIEGISNLYNTQLLVDNKLIKASDIYTIKVSNPYQNYDNTKPVRLEFEYYGPQNGGIYKFINNTWTYLPSKISEEKITTYLNPSSLSTAVCIYGVFVDESAVNIKDIRGHWAKDEIITYINRNHTEPYNDGTFRPNSPISRGQLLTLLSKVYNWNLNNLDKSIMDLEKIEDYDSFGDHKNLVAYALKHGYMGLFSDNTFKINNNISYNQLNNIMRKVTGESSFNWYNTAYYMMNDKDTLSKSYDSMENSITRAEAIYMLYLINEWKY